MEIVKQFAVDNEKAAHGVWVPISQDARLKIARTNNPNFRRVFRKLIAPYTAAIRTNSLSDDLDEKIMVQAMAETILVDWQGITENGEPVPYTVEKAKEYLMHEPFREMVSTFSRDLELFKQAQDEETEKNL